MTVGRFGIMADRVSFQHRTPDAAAMRAARSPDDLARLVLAASTPHFGVAVALLPAGLRSEAIAALLAYRVLGAYERLSDHPQEALVAAVDYLAGGVHAPPPPPAASVGSDTVDVLLVERVRDARALLAGLPVEGRNRVGRMLVDVGQVIMHQVDHPQSRTEHGKTVLGRVALYGCSLVTESVCAEVDLSELAGCVGATAQLARDLLSGDPALYDADNPEELTQAVMLRLLAPALGSLALLARLGPRTPSRGARIATAYTTISTTTFLCASVGARAPYRRRLRLAAAVMTSLSPIRWGAMLERVRGSADEAIHQVLGASPTATRILGLGDLRSLPPSMGPLLIGATFSLVASLPEEPLTGVLSQAQVHSMMIADHLAFGALERLPVRDPGAMQTLATQLQMTALDITAPGAHL